jgi:hypothetical protein
MLRKSKSPVNFHFARAGGSKIIAHVDVWQATPSDWKHVSEVKFTQVTKPKESHAEPLPKGDYLCVFQCFVQESLNGKYDFKFDVAAKPTFLDAGDVNTTAATNDAKVFKDQFVLRVQ